MRPNFNHSQQKNSQQIQMHIAQKAKSRNRVIGSVVILLCTLAILLNVTSNVKQININPSVVEIKNSAIEASEAISSAPIAIINQNSSDTIPNNTSSPIEVANQPQTVETKNIVNNTQTTDNNGFKAGVVSKTTKSNNTVSLENNPSIPAENSNKAKVATTTSIKTEEHITIKNIAKPTPTSKKPVNPEDILDGIADDLSPQPQKVTKQKENLTQGGKAYIQFAALSSENGVNKLKQELADQGVHTNIQKIETSKGVLYRLRAGPFSSEVAQSKLQKIKANGYSGMITGN